MLQLRPDPIQRTLLIDTFPNWRGDVAELAPIVADSTDATFRSGVCLGIGSVPAKEVTAEAKQAWQPLLSEWYKAQPDPGTHGAAGWALRKWQLPLPKIASSAEPVNGYEWYVNSLGMTIFRIPAGKFSRPRVSGNAAAQEVRLTRPFFLCDREVPVGLFQQFMDDTGYGDEKPKDWTGPAKGISRTPDDPVQQVNWDAAVLFCNWLSRKERLTPCYERSGKKRKNVRVFGDGKRVEDEIDVREWERVGEANGYRLPTEAEWEYACRSESVTEFGHGDDESLLSKYAVINASRTEPCGSKLPNGWGLFDMHGNVWEWCADWYNDYAGASAIDDPGGPQDSSPGSIRVNRGGCWNYRAEFCRSAFRGRFTPSYRGYDLGFRVARSPSVLEAGGESSGSPRSLERRPKGDVRSGAEPLPLRAEAAGAAPLSVGPAFEEGVELEAMEVLGGQKGSSNFVTFRDDGRDSLDLSVERQSEGRPLVTWINGVSFSPDGARIAGPAEGDLVKLWDAENGKELLALPGHQSCANGVAFSPDGTRISVVTNGGEVKVWDLESHRVVSVLSGHRGPAIFSTFHADGRLLVTTGFDGTVRVWDPAIGRPLAILHGLTSGVPHAAFSPDGRRIAAGDWDSNLRIWDISPLLPKDGEPVPPAAIQDQ